MNSINNFNLRVKKIKKKFSRKKIYLHEPLIENNDLISVGQTLKKNQISPYGITTNIFEKKLENFLNSKNILCLINGTSALHLSLKVLNINKNHEIFVPSLTYVSTVNAVKYCEASPIFFEIEKKTLSIDLEKFESFLKKNTFVKDKKCFNKKTKKQIKVLIIVHVNGLCCEIVKLKKILKKYYIILVEDAAEALGSKYKKTFLGNFGEIGMLSFNGNKIITTGGGGALIFKKKSLYKKAKLYSTNCKIKHSFEYLHSDIGYNYRMPSLNAALGVSQLKKLQYYINKKKKLAKFYKKIFNSKDFQLVEPLKNCQTNYWLNTLEIKNNKISKNHLINQAHLEGFYVRPMWKPMHLLSQFKNCQRMELKVTEEIYDNFISLPSSAFLQK